MKSFEGTILWKDIVKDYDLSPARKTRLNEELGKVFEEYDDRGNARLMYPNPNIQLMWAFLWKGTPQGHGFWDDIDDGDFSALI